MTAPPGKGRLLLLCGLLVVGVLAAEGAVVGVSLLFGDFGGDGPESDESARPLAVAGEATMEGAIRWDRTMVEVIHPFLGYVQDPNRSDNVSYLGFPQWQDDPLQAAGPGVVTVAIFGSSFAEGLSIKAESALQESLRKQGIESRVITLAMGGFKQPQQLMALNYVLSLGAKIDVVVNMDGFAEVALPPLELIPEGINPFYPRVWQNRLVGLADQELLAGAGRVAYLEDRRRRWARRMGDLPGFSLTRRLVWPVLDRRMEARLAEARKDLSDKRKSDHGDYMREGPDLAFGSESETFEALARHWKECSLLMEAICASRGIAYLHFLHPNQYYEPGRKLTPEEKRSAFREDHPYRPGVVHGYPRLIEAGAELRQAGVNFHDLTLIFKDVPDPVYKDECCHPYDSGYDIIAEYVGREIARALNRPKALTAQVPTGDR